MQMQNKVEIIGVLIAKQEIQHTVVQHQGLLRYRLAHSYSMLFQSRHFWGDSGVKKLSIISQSVETAEKQSQ